MNCIIPKKNIRHVVSLCILQPTSSPTSACSWVWVLLPLAASSL